MGEDEEGGKLPCVDHGPPNDGAVVKSYSGADLTEKLAWIKP